MLCLSAYHRQRTFTDTLARTNCTAKSGLRLVQRKEIVWHLSNRVCRLGFRRAEYFSACEIQIGACTATPACVYLVVYFSKLFFDWQARTVWLARYLGCVYTPRNELNRCIRRYGPDGLESSKAIKMWFRRMTSLHDWSTFINEKAIYNLSRLLRFLQ